MSKNAMSQTSELFALIEIDQKTRASRFARRFNGGVATYRTYGMADSARRKKGREDLVIVRFVRDERPTKESDWWKNTGKIIKGQKSQRRHRGD